jgi:hypothetical protein
MQYLSRLCFCLCALAALFLTSCGTMKTTSTSGSYRVVAKKPNNPENVEIKLSLATQNVYVLEGDRLLMAVQGTVGKPGHATPSGRFKIYLKNKTKRRISQPDAGYPMAYWLEFKSAYGFHEGFVHASPRTHGCIRLHREAAARLFALTRIGTPVHIAQSLPEDEKYGSQVRRLDQSRDPDPPRSQLMSASWFQDPPGPLLVD